MSGSPFLFELAGRGTVVLTGKDRATFLHGLVTNDVKKLAPDQGCAAAFLTAKGKMLAECVVLCEAERLVLDTPAELSGAVEALLRKYLVFNDVTITNETLGTSVFHLTGEAAGDGGEEEDLLRRVMGPGDSSALPAGPHAHSACGPIRIVRENRTGVPGFDLRVPSSLSREFFSPLLSSGVRLETPERLESLRVGAGIPRWGAELTEAVLPDEAGLRERGFISENKGCYVGQETVARIKTYGHVNRRLVRLLVSGGVPSPGDEVLFEGEKSGVVTSAARAAGDLVDAASVALAYVRRERADEGTALTISPLEGNLPAFRASVASAPLV